MDQIGSVSGQAEEKVTTPVGKFGDPAAAFRPLTMHQAASRITMFGHRINNAVLVATGRPDAAYLQPPQTCRTHRLGR